MRPNKILQILFFSLFFFLVQTSIFAAGDETLDKVMKFMLVVTLIVIAFVLWLTVVYSEKNDSEGKTFKALLNVLRNALTKSTPIEKEQEILLHHNYDGIQELDNRIPPWFAALFYGTIIWGVIYFLSYHVFDDGQVQSKEYNLEIQQAALERQILIKTGAFINEETVTLLNDAASLAEGKELYVKNCVTCHGQNGEGLVGPNLTDGYWIHGGGIKNIFKTVKYGVPQKGMISWQTQLDPKKMQTVSSYIISLHGTNPPNGKQPEGTKWEEPIQTDTLKTIGS